jgi:N-dimethylarginine dimethylaminohydrolase
MGKTEQTSALLDPMEAQEENSSLVVLPGGEKRNTSTYVIAKAPHSPWWGEGIIPQPGCQAMEAAVKEQINNALAQQEIESVERIYTRNLRQPTIVTDFSCKLDMLYKHDGVFQTDGVVTTISKTTGKPLAFQCYFHANYRQEEAESMINLLQQLGIQTIDIPADKNMFLEGGEVHYEGGLYFGGTYRANKKGHQFVIDKSQVTDSIIFQINNTHPDIQPFHLDTYFCPVLSPENKVIAVLVCLECITDESKNELKDFCQRHHIRILPIDLDDSVGIKGKGKYAVNCMPAPGVLYGNGPFMTPGIEEKLQELGIDHKTVSTDELGKSGGSFHCLTQRLPRTNIPQEKVQSAIQDYMYAEADILQHKLRNLEILVKKDIAGLDDQYKTIALDRIITHMKSIKDLTYLEQYGVPQALLNAILSLRDKMLCLFPQSY